MRIVEGGLCDPRVIDLIRAHISRAQAVSPPKSTHALDPDALRAPEISFWSAWDDERLLGIGALFAHSARHGEIKSMHTAEKSRRRGVGSAMLRHIVSTAIARGFERISLETGSMDYFASARALYARHGFVECQPFEDYRLDPNSIFMTLDLARK